ncbi:DUF1360 domain-containing protein [Evansella tamaricis]|uniref:DUF1360 domain-containing protein n=1 Tax=Evansella tamaricis TaxID=2069301 RepID=A0ABS6JI74_9BACI|nr:DUF1360 domain-containing protein [Evansella tamaricis]MBU9713291.1 DUF1360 domain-containing protein [Evansella tamaricis]
MTEITVFQFLLFSLAVFRLTHLLLYDSITEFIRKGLYEYEQEVDEDGKEETVQIIAHKGWKKWFGELFSCHWCMGIWASILLWLGFSLLPSVFSVVIIILAAAGVAAVVESVVVRWLLY